MSPAQLQITEWWHSGKNFEAGIMLLQMHGKNKHLVRNITKSPQRYARKLEAELCKCVGLDFKNMPKLPSGTKKIKTVLTPKVQSAAIITKPGELAANPEFLPDETVNTGKPIEQYPKIIRQIKMELSKLYNDRSILFRRMTREVPEDNSAENKQKRAVLRAEILKKSKEMDRIYTFEKAYEEKGITPLPEQVWPAQKGETPLPDDINDLKKLKKNLQTANTKSRNMLLYQSKIKLNREKPMPEGPKRQRVELQIKRREDQIRVIDQKLVDIEISK